MAGLIEGVFGRQAGKDWQAARSKYRKSQGKAQPSNIFDALYAASEVAQKSLREGMTTAALSTPQGKTVVAEAEKSRVREYLRNPSFLVVIGVVVAAIFLMGRKL